MTMMFISRLLIAAFLFVLPLTSGAMAKTLSASEVKSQMLNRSIITRRFGLKVTMRYRSNGTVSANALIGSVNGTWRQSGNRICTTFPSGPAKGTECVTFEKLGPNQYRSSKGVRFRVN